MVAEAIYVRVEDIQEFISEAHWTTLNPDRGEVSIHWPTSSCKAGKRAFEAIPLAPLYAGYKIDPSQGILHLDHIDTPGLQFILHFYRVRSAVRDLYQR